MSGQDRNEGALELFYREKKFEPDMREGDTNPLATADMVGRELFQFRNCVPMVRNVHQHELYAEVETAFWAFEAVSFRGQTSI
jgi:hypothetical protein